MTLSRIRPGLALVALGVVLLVGAPVACILADEPPQLPNPSPQRPAIVHGGAVPTLLHDIDDPADLDRFIVPVEVDADQPLLYKVFLDFDPPNSVRVIQEGIVDIPRTGTSTIRTVDFSLKAAFDVTTCHEILVTVALRWAPGGYSPVTPPGGDQAHWSYRPRGVACQAYDAGPPPPDAGSDADAGAVDGSSEGGDP